MSSKSGLVQGEGQKAQHQDMYRKLMLRKHFLPLVVPGSYYVPFIGDGDIANELYKDKPIYGADNDPERVKTASSRLTSATLRVADCDTFPFSDIDTTYSLADFDSYSYPYDAFRSFWQSQKDKITSPCVLYFTDGQRQAINRTSHWTHPDGRKMQAADSKERRVAYNYYWTQTILPWFTRYIYPWRVIKTEKYIRDTSMLYWAVAIDKGEGPINIPTSIGASRGQRKKFDKDKKAAYLELLRAGKRRTLSAREIGIDPATVAIHISNDPQFSEQVSRAEMEAHEHVEDALYEAAISGNVVAAQVWLYNRKPVEWKDKRTVEQTGKDGGPVTVRVVYDEPQKPLTP